MEEFRGIPSRERAVSMRVFTLGSPSYISFNFGLVSKASRRVIWGVEGTSLATTSVSA